MPGNEITTLRKRFLPSPEGLTCGFSTVERRDDTNSLIYTDANQRAIKFPRGTQVTVSENHRWPPVKGVRDDVGGDFFTQKSYVKNMNESYPMKVRQVFGPYGDPPFTTSRITTHIGPIFPLDVEWLEFPPASTSTNDNLDEMGATAIARCSPTNSVIDLSTSLGELLKDGLPSLVGAELWKSKTGHARKSGSEYLNVQFGWAPVVSDILGLKKVITHAEVLLKQFERDIGRDVRRKYYFPSYKSSEETVLSMKQVPFGLFHSDLDGPYENIGRVVRTRETVRNSWFSGAFTYHAPTGYNSRYAIERLAARADKLVGLTMTPETLWNIAPWSWAVDWFTNTGDVLRNLSNYGKYGLVLRYGYVMEHTIVSDTYTNEWRGPTGYSYRCPPLTLVTETKVRRRANPFGFGVHWDSLSNFQLSIVAALGISRGRR